MAIAAKKVGSTNFGVMYCAEAAACQELVAPLEAIGPKYGVKLAYNTQISFSAPSYAAECLAAQQAGVKALFIGDAVTVVESVAKDCAAQGYYPTIVASDGAVGIQFASTPGPREEPVGLRAADPVQRDQHPGDQGDGRRPSRSISPPS